MRTPRTDAARILGAVVTFLLAVHSSPARTPDAGAASTIRPKEPSVRDVPLLEKKFAELSNQKISKDGKKALAIAPEKWKHAETDHFTLHYHRTADARKVAREVEYDLAYVAAALGAAREHWPKKSHVYIFEDEDEWTKFLQVSDNPMKWAASYALGDELYLDIRGGTSGSGNSLDFHTLAHETTHAVVARLYPGDGRPLWLSEGFAECMGRATVAARRGPCADRHERGPGNAEIPIESLTRMTDYPSDPQALQKLYQTSERVVRFLMTEGGRDRFPKFVQTIASGRSMMEAVPQVYPDKFKDWPSFTKSYAKFTE